MQRLCLFNWSAVGVGDAGQRDARADHRIGRAQQGDGTAMISFIRDGAIVMVTNERRTWQTTCATVGEAKVLVQRLYEAPTVTLQWMKLTGFRKTERPLPARLDHPVAAPLIPATEIKAEAPSTDPEADDDRIDIGPGLRRTIF